jgi:hypothetical protein
MFALALNADRLIGIRIEKMGKNPAFQFYPNDWLRDTVTLSPQAKGGWIDLLAKMHYNTPRGQICDNYTGYARLFGCDKHTAKKIIDELRKKGICEYVTNGLGNVTLINRRMDKEEKIRESNRKRKEKQRSRESHKKVIPLSSSSKDSSSKDTTKKTKNTCAGFDNFWQEYPRKKSKGQAEKAWEKIKPNKALLATMIDKIKQAKNSNEWIKENGQFIPYPATWLNAKGWEDEYNIKTKRPTGLVI